MENVGVERTRWDQRARRLARRISDGYAALAPV